MFPRHKYFAPEGEPAPAADPAPASPPVPAADPAPASPPAPAAENFFKTVPETWRQDLVQLAGFEGDEQAKRLAQLDRVSSPGVLAKNYFHAEDRIRRGEISNGLPENPTDEQLANWRAANGIPATPEEYKAELGEGLVLSEFDEEIISQVNPIAHKHNIPAKALNEIINTVLTARQSQAVSLRDRDAVDRQKTEKELRSAWGNDFVGNKNAIDGLINLLPESVQNTFLNARGPDGRALFNDPAFVVALGDWSRQLNPTASIVPNANNPTQAIDDEIKSLEKRMRTDPEWHKDTAAHARYQQLVDAQEKMRSKA